MKKKNVMGGLSNEYIYKKQRSKSARLEKSGEQDFSYQRADPITIDASRYVHVQAQKFRHNITTSVTTMTTFIN